MFFRNDRLFKIGKTTDPAWRIKPAQTCAADWQGHRHFDQFQELYFDKWINQRIWQWNAN